MLATPSDKEHHVSPKKKTTENDEVEATTPEPTSVAETVEAPAVAETPQGPRYTRGVVAAGVAGLLAAGGVAGFAIGRETGENDGPRITQVGENFPGQGAGQGGPQSRRNESGDRQFPQFPDQGSGPDMSQQDSEGDTSGT